MTVIAFFFANVVCLGFAYVSYGKGALAKLDALLLLTCGVSVGFYTLTGIWFGLEVGDV